MSRRLGYLGALMILLFAVIIGQSVYLQFFHAEALNQSPLNPRQQSAGQHSPRGVIEAADGEILAQSVKSGNSLYPWMREYPLGSLTAGVVGWVSNSHGDWGLEAQYSSDLIAHKQPPKSLAQVLAPVTAADSIQLTLEPALQRVAAKALHGEDGAVVALDPRTGAVLAMYSNPTYNPNPMSSPNVATEDATWAAINKNNAHHFPPLGMIATQQSFPPGSTMKVVTTASVVVNKPQLLFKSYPRLVCTPLPNTNKVLCNDGLTSCGGLISIMLPVSCDPGYGLVGLDLGGTDLSATANSFGYNQSIPIDLPGVATSYFPSAATLKYDQPQVAYSAIGQENVRATALQNALVAAAIANGGTTMTPHFLSQIISPSGKVVSTYKPAAWLNPMTPTQAQQIVPLMQNVVRFGTAAYVGFLPQDDVAAKTGTAQTGNSAHNTDDWMIAFAPATHPVVAVAVIVPYQNISTTGAEAAGPVMKCVIEGALALNEGLPASGTATTCK